MHLINFFNFKFLLAILNLIIYLLAMPKQIETQYKFKHS